MLNIVAPIAGKSYFFDNEKDGFPKPFIEICGKTMLEHFVKNYENIKNKRFIFILKEEDVKRYHLDDAINVLTNNQSKIIILKNETQGMVCSVLMAIDEIDLNDSLLIVNMDQIFEYDLNEVVSELSLNDAGVLSFESVHPRWAYVKCDKNNFVLEAFEKKPVSKNAIAGFYYFNKADFFVKSAFDMIKKDVNYEGKYFIALTLNELILQDKKIINISIDKNRYFTFYSHAKINEYERIKNA
ncbi:glycosyltransferase family 2 protein [Campylobacter jejuni]|uniref:NTP transferase domain-containing protein n=1 Tax=Campylobacter jejuni TaxID=197 RepID=A0A625JUB4_CAMJU|nr:glycosyl transferase family 2 [Campylobacter jejuni]EAI1001207.1 glycosyl transferase family 2 [Campylobacter jejuni]EAI6598371.1 glycosyl transferase family 2 [Campylobacter jejuni]EAJ1569444.1 glycosyl transferase family 2 [Campylobacter jejuni]EAK4198244.1 glycosyl transferase family 2 [Campylobacter jejuni]